MKVIYNAGYGYITFSDEALELLNQKRLDAKLPLLNQFDDIEFLSRDDILLVEVVQELGSDVNRRYYNCDIRLEDIPPDYSQIYEIRGNGRSEIVICDPDKLLLHQLKHWQINDMSTTECKTALSEIIRILNTRVLRLK